MLILYTSNTKAMRLSCAAALLCGAAASSAAAPGEDARFMFVAVASISS